jgi:hypothetical protein
LHQPRLTALLQGTLFQGTVRVNSKNTSQVFIDVPSFNHNAIVASAAAVNRAMEGDTVAGYSQGFHFARGVFRLLSGCDACCSEAASKVYLACAYRADNLSC